MTTQYHETHGGSGSPGAKTPARYVECGAYRVAVHNLETAFALLRNAKPALPEMFLISPHAKGSRLLDRLLQLYDVVSANGNAHAMYAGLTRIKDELEVRATEVFPELPAILAERAQHGPEVQRFYDVLLRHVFDEPHKPEESLYRQCLYHALMATYSLGDHIERQRKRVAQ